MRTSAGRRAYKNNYSIGSNQAGSQSITQLGLNCVQFALGGASMKTSRSGLFKHGVGFLAALGMLLLPASSAFAHGASHSELIATTGQGEGHAIVVPTAQDHGTFAANITVEIEDAAPYTTFDLWRAPDLTPDGKCTGSYIPFGQTLTTSAEGEGALHFTFHRGAPFVSGVQFDVAFQARGSDGSVLQGHCMRVTVK
jgi:hypothetical protein